MSTNPPGSVAPPEVVELATGRRLPQAELDRWARQLVRAFETRGVPRGAPVAMLLDNCIESIVVMRAIMAGGMHVVPVAPYLHPDEVEYIIRDSGAAGLITKPSVGADVLDRAMRACPVRLVANTPSTSHDDDFAEALAAESDEPLEDPSMGTMMRYSSGTTGKPKGIVLRDVPTKPGYSRDFFTPVLMNLSMDGSSRLLLTAPIYHAGPMLMAGGAQLIGASLILMSSFDAARALQAIEDEHVTHSYWVPTMFNRLLRLAPAQRAAHDLSSHVAALHVGAPCSRPVKEQMMRWWGPIVHELYGGSEGVGMTYARPEEWLEHPGTVGRPIGCDIHICGSDGEGLPTGVAGNVFFDTGSIGFEYHRDPEKLREATHVSQDSWVTLGDIGYLDDDGFLYLTDRRADVIVAGGVNIYTREVEDALSTHPAVLDVVVVGMPDDDLGERVTALVEVAKGAGDERLAYTLSEHVADTLARLKRPRQVVFTDQIPRAPTGKARKQDVLAAIQTGEGAGRSYRVQTAAARDQESQS